MQSSWVIPAHLLPPRGLTMRWKTGLLIRAGMNPEKQMLEQLRINRDTPEERSFSAVWLIVLLLLVLVAVALWWWFRSRPEPARTTTILPPKEAVVTKNAANSVLNASGYVTPRREATVSSKVIGKVIEVLVEEGMRVK